MPRLFVESLDCECRERVLRHLSSRPHDAATDEFGLATFVAMLDDPVGEPLAVAGWELLGVPKDMRPLVRSLYRVLRDRFRDLRTRGPQAPGDEVVVVVVDCDVSRAFEAAMACGKRPNATHSDFYEWAREDPVDVVLSIIPDARVVRVRPAADALSMADLWRIDDAIDALGRA